MIFRQELLDELFQNCKTQADLFGNNGILKQLSKAFIERSLNAELDFHLEQQRLETDAEIEQNSPEKGKNRRNGYSQKTVTGDFGKTQINIPRDRNGEFVPQILPKGQTRFDGFNDKIISLYARGMTTRDIQAQLEEMYGVEVSPALISQVTNAVEEDRKIWQNRLLDPIYPIVYFDAIVVKIRQDVRVINKAVHLVLGVNMLGRKELLGMWITENESSKFWLSVLTDLQNRGVKDIFIACIDGLTGFPEAVETVFPKTRVQLCIVHMIRNSLSYVSYKHRKQVAAALKTVYSAVNSQEAEQNLIAFADQWDHQYPMISKSWMNHWERIIPFLAFPEDIRRAIYTTNAIESVNMSLRKVLRNHRSFPTDESAMKLIYLAINNISKKWTMPIHNWKAALNRFAIEFEGRFPL